MGKILDYLAEHKIALVAVCMVGALLLYQGLNLFTSSLFTGGSTEETEVVVEQATDSTDDATDSTDDATDSTDDATDSTDDATDSTDDATDSTDDATDSTDDEVLYTGELAVLMEALSTEYWVDTDLESVATFTDTTLTISAGADTSTTYDLTALAAFSDTTSEDIALAETEIFVMLSDGSYSVIRLYSSEVETDGGTLTYRLVSSDLFDGTYTNLYEYQELMTSGFDDAELVELVGESGTEQLEEELTELVCANYPTYDELSWERVVTIDYDANIAYLSFVLTSRVVELTTSTDSETGELVGDIYTDTSSYLISVAYNLITGEMEID